MKLLLLLLILLNICNITYSNVIGIDLASDQFKVAIVQPGTPLEIVTNFQSKRKTPTCLTFYKGERHFGSDSVALMGRKPELSFAKLYRLIGRNINHPSVKEITEEQYFPYKIYSNDTTHSTTLTIDQTYYTPEELIAMILQHIKDMTANFGGKVIKDCVITVPASFTQHERTAVYTAAEIADLKVLSLIEENTAAALHYGMDRTFDEPKIVMYYNMGAGNIQVSIVKYSSYMTKEMGKNKTIGQFEIMGKSWDGNLGGFNFDVKLSELLADRFNEIWKKKKNYKNNDNIKNHIIPMTKLRIQASKVKEILSANQEFPVRIEQLHADIDLHTKVTRNEFEEACSELLSKITIPIDKALAIANLTINDIDSVELLGGSVRIPAIKKNLDTYFSNTKVDIGQHLNGDEAMALGAAFRAANLSTAFRVRKVGMSDISSFGVSVQLNTLNSNDKNNKDEIWSKFTPLYPVHSLLSSKTKTVAFNYDKDITCQLQYDVANKTNKIQTNELPLGTDEIIAQYNITGITDFAKETQEKGLGMPKVHLSFVLDSSGIVSLVKAEATVELPVEENKNEGSIVNDDNNNSTSTTDAESTETNNEVDASNNNETNSTTIETNNTTTATDNTNSTTSSTNKTKKNAKKEIKKDNILRKTLLITRNNDASNPPIWTNNRIIEAKQRLQLLNDIDNERKAKEAAMNDLEAYVYKVRNQLMEDEDKLAKVSTSEQRQEVIDMANEAEEWLYDEGRDQTVDVYNAKQLSIKTKAETIFKRHSELTKRPAAVTKALKQLNNVTELIKTWDVKMPHITTNETEKLINLINKAEEWINDKVKEQESVSLTEDPVFYSTDIPPQLKPVITLLDKLLKKPKPAPPKPEKNTTIETNTTNTETDDSNTIKVELETDGENKDSETTDDDVSNEEL